MSEAEDNGKEGCEIVFVFKQLLENHAASIRKA